MDKEEDMIQDYLKLHRLGITHSIEAFIAGKRVSGLYGLAMGKMFFGESMFHQVPEASKICLTHLMTLSLQYGIELIDCQAHTPHLEKMVAKRNSRSIFSNQIKIFLKNLNL